MDAYEELQCIGRGSYGSAHLVRERSSGARFVVKKIPMELLSAKEKAQSFREVELLAKLSHPNVVEYKENFVRDDVLHIVMAYCDGGDLAGRVRERAEAKAFFDTPQILDWFVQMALAIKYLHEQRILHRDLKASNVFLTTENVVKLGDFGIAKTLDSTLDQARTVVGTPYYMSPEVCESKPYSYASDVWALGCVLYELVALRHAFDAPNILTLILKIVQQDFSPIPEHNDPQMHELLHRLLDKSPEKRPTMDQILAMPYIRNHMQGFVASGGSLRMNPVARRPPGAIKRRVHPKNTPRRGSGDRRRLRAPPASQSINISVSSSGVHWPSATSPVVAHGIRQDPSSPVRWMPIAPVDADDDQVVHLHNDDLELVETSILEESQLNLRLPERSMTPEPLVADPGTPRNEVEEDIHVQIQKGSGMSYSPVAPQMRAKLNAWGGGTQAMPNGGGGGEVEEDEEDIDSRFHAEAQELMNPNFQSEYSDECMDSLQIYYGSQVQSHRTGGENAALVAPPAASSPLALPTAGSGDETLVNASRWGRRRHSITRDLRQPLDILSLNKQESSNSGDATNFEDGEDAESVAASLTESGILRELEMEAASSGAESGDGDSSLGEYDAEENFYSDDSDFYEDNATQYSDDFDDSEAEIIEYADDEFLAEDVLAVPELRAFQAEYEPAMNEGDTTASPGSGITMSPTSKQRKLTTEVQWVMRTVAQSLMESGESAA